MVRCKTIEEVNAKLEESLKEGKIGRHPLLQPLNLMRSQRHS